MSDSDSDPSDTAVREQKDRTDTALENVSEHYHGSPGLGNDEPEPGETRTIERNGKNDKSE